MVPSPSGAGPTRNGTQQRGTLLYILFTCFIFAIKQLVKKIGSPNWWNSINSLMSCHFTVRRFVRGQPCKWRVQFAPTGLYFLQLGYILLDRLSILQPLIESYDHAIIHVWPISSTPGHCTWVSTQKLDLWPTQYCSSISSVLVECLNYQPQWFCIKFKVLHTFQNM